MTLELGNSKNFKALCVDLVLRTGLVDFTQSDALSIPDDIVDNALIRRFLSDGYALFLRSDPNWSFMRQELSITFDPNGTGPWNVNRDAARYRLPSFVTSTALTPWQYAAGSQQYTVLAQRPIDQIRRMQQTSSNSGVPVFFGEGAIPSNDRVGSPSVAREVVFYPTPATVYTVSAWYRVTKFSLDADEEVSVAGPDHDRAIVDAAFYLWQQYDKAETDPNAVALAKAQWDQSLIQSVALDDKLRGGNIGAMTSPRRARGPAYDWFVNDVPVYLDGTRIV